MDIITIGGNKEIYDGDLLRALSEQLNNTQFTESWQKTLALSLCTLLTSECNTQTTIDDILYNTPIGYWTRIEIYVDTNLTVFVNYIKQRDVTLAEYLQKPYNSTAYTLGNILANRHKHIKHTIITYNHYYKIPENHIIYLDDKRKF
jgi:hypothetical protein